MSEEIQEKRAPLMVYMDIEATDIKKGDPVAIGFLWVDPTTEEEIFSTIIYCKLPDNPEWHEYVDKAGNSDHGEGIKNKYKNLFEQGCTDALPDDVIARQIQALIPEGSRLCYFNCSNGDRLCLERRFPSLKPFLKKCRTLDVATDMAWKVWVNDGLGKRKLERIAEALNVPHGDLTLHTPVDDCKLAHRVKMKLDKLLEADQLLQDAGLPHFTGKDPDKLVLPLDKEIRQRYQATTIDLTVPPSKTVVQTEIVGKIESQMKTPKPKTDQLDFGALWPCRYTVTAEQRKQIMEAVQNHQLQIPCPLPDCQGESLVVWGKSTNNPFLACPHYKNGCQFSCGLGGDKFDVCRELCVPVRKQILEFLGVPEDRWDLTPPNS